MYAIRQRFHLTVSNLLVRDTIDLFRLRMLQVVPVHAPTNTLQRLSRMIQLTLLDLESVKKE